MISQVINQFLNIDVSVLMGANLADEVADGHLCEATLGCEPTNEISQQLKKLFQTESFRISIAFEPTTVELCGALKFVDHFFPGSNVHTFFESCGIADLIATCYGGRNRALCEAIVKTKRNSSTKRLKSRKTLQSLKDVEEELLKGQSAQGPSCAEAIVAILMKFNIEEKFPLFMAVNVFCKNEIEPMELIMKIRNAPPSHFGK